MKWERVEISKSDYDECKLARIPSENVSCKYIPDSIRKKYGVYAERVFRENDKYYIEYIRGDLKGE